MPAKLCMLILISLIAICALGGCEEQDDGITNSLSTIDRCLSNIYKETYERSYSIGGWSESMREREVEKRYLQTKFYRAELNKLLFRTESIVKAIEIMREDTAIPVKLKEAPAPAVEHAAPKPCQLDEFTKARLKALDDKFGKIGEQ